MENQERGVLPRKVKGFRDIDSRLNQLRWKIIDAASKVYQSYGFEHLDTPVMEYADAIGKYMPDEDTADKGVYSFRNPEEEPVYKADGRELRGSDGKVIMENHLVALRYDLTAPLARKYAEDLLEKRGLKQINQGKPPLMRRFQYGPVYRYEIKLTPGRFREFWQLDFDSVGAKDVSADAEVCMILSEALEAIGLERGSYVVKVNNRKVLKGFLQSCGVTDDEQEGAILRVFDKLDKIGWEDMQLELGAGRTDSSGAEVPGLGLGEDLISKIMAFLKNFDAGQTRKEVLKQLSENLAENEIAQEGLAELQKIDDLLDALGFDESRVIFDPTLIRGMAYYTGPVFEVESFLKYKDEKGKERQFGSICGGGRYDGLVEKLLGLKVPATGASIGVDRLADLLDKTNKLASTVTGPVLIAHFDDSLALEYQKMARDLRAAGINTQIYYGLNQGFRGMKKQAKFADQQNCPVLILMGSDEAEKGIVSVKNLKLGSEIASQISDKAEFKARVQKEVSRADLVEFVKSIL